MLLCAPRIMRVRVWPLRVRWPAVASRASTTVVSAPAPAPFADEVAGEAPSAALVLEQLLACQDASDPGVALVEVQMGCGGSVWHALGRQPEEYMSLLREVDQHAGTEWLLRLVRAELEQQDSHASSWASSAAAENAATASSRPKRTLQDFVPPQPLLLDEENNDLVSGAHASTESNIEMAGGASVPAAQQHLLRHPDAHLLACALPFIHQQRLGHVQQIFSLFLEQRPEQVTPRAVMLLTKACFGRPDSAPLLQLGDEGECKTREHNERGSGNEESETSSSVVQSQQLWTDFFHRWIAQGSALARECGWPCWLVAQLAPARHVNWREVAEWQARIATRADLLYDSQSPGSMAERLQECMITGGVSAILALFALREHRRLALHETAYHAQGHTTAWFGERYHRRRHDHRDEAGEHDVHEPSARSARIRDGESQDNHGRGYIHDHGNAREPTDIHNHSHDSKDTSTLRLQPRDPLLPQVLMHTPLPGAWAILPARLAPPTIWVKAVEYVARRQRDPWAALMLVFAMSARYFVPPRLWLCMLQAFAQHGNIHAARAVHHAASHVCGWAAAGGSSAAVQLTQDALVADAFVVESHLAAGDVQTVHDMVDERIRNKTALPRHAFLLCQAYARNADMRAALDLPDKLPADLASEALLGFCTQLAYKHRDNKRCTRLFQRLVSLCDTNGSSLPKRILPIAVSEFNRNGRSDRALQAFAELLRLEGVHGHGPEASGAQMAEREQAALDQHQSPHKKRNAKKMKQRDSVARYTWVAGTVAAVREGHYQQAVQYWTASGLSVDSSKRGQVRCIARAIVGLADDPRDALQCAHDLGLHTLPVGVWTAVWAMHKGRLDDEALEPCKPNTAHASFMRTLLTSALGCTTSDLRQSHRRFAHVDLATADLLERADSLAHEQADEGGHRP